MLLQLRSGRPEADSLFLPSFSRFRSRFKKSLWHFHPFVVSQKLLVCSTYDIMDSMDTEKEKYAADTERELVRLWRVWRTVHEMCQDRV